MTKKPSTNHLISLTKKDSFIKFLIGPLQRKTPSYATHMLILDLYHNFLENNMDFYLRQSFSLQLITGIELNAVYLLGLKSNTMHPYN